MGYKRLAGLVKRFADRELLAEEIESLEDVQDVVTIDDLSDFLEEELSWAGQ